MYNLGHFSLIIVLAECVNGVTSQTPEIQGQETGEVVRDHLVCSLILSQRDDSLSRVCQPGNMLIQLCVPHPVPSQNSLKRKHNNSCVRIKLTYAT